MKSILLSPPCLAVMGLVLTAASPPPPAQFGLACSGTETLRIGQEAPKQVSYDVTLSIDLAAARYCYAACDHGQSFPITDVASSPLKLADSRTPQQQRRILLDRATMTLTDDQVLAMASLPPVERHAGAQCKPAPFHAPPPSQ